MENFQTEPISFKLLYIYKQVSQTTSTPVVNEVFIKEEIIGKPYFSAILSEESLQGSASGT